MTVRANPRTPGRKTAKDAGSGTPMVTPLMAKTEPPVLSEIEAISEVELSNSPMKIAEPSSLESEILSQ